MARIKEILKIKEDVVFGGAIQADWYYDNRGVDAAKNFVFHGPNYFGVLEDEVEYTSHKLIDTCSFAENIARKIVTGDGNPISLAIAGYGTGKSHLAVTLANLFSKPLSTTSKTVLSNIKVASKETSQYIDNNITKPNFCIVLNGMKDFNLNYEIISNIKKSLKENGVSDEFLSEFTKAYSIARTFIERNYDRFEKEFILLAEKRELSVTDLKDYLIKNVYKDEVFDLINELYKDIAGEYIRWDEGVTGAEVIKKISEKLCGDNQPYNKILIIFDEFGRYLEYVSAYPNRAGDAALQQIYDVVTASENNILFLGFIQSDLKTYLARVSKSSNVSRYIGRYESGEKLYLSSNIETIFANIIEKYDDSAFNYYIKDILNKKENQEIYNKMFNSLNNWTINSKSRGLWNDINKFRNVIVEGIYPFHPLTTYLLTSLSDWYQQRSALQFLIRSFKSIEHKEIKELGDLPQVYAIDLLKGDLFKELLLAEEEGRQKSEYCTVYDKIISKYDEKLDAACKDVLTAILALKLLKFKVKNKEDLQFVFENLTGFKQGVINSALEELEDKIGVISYDDKNHTYDFVEDATGINDFNRFIRKKKNELTIPFNVMINEGVMEKVGISQNLKPDFSIKNNIKTSEWQFEQQLVPVGDINSNFVEIFIKEFKQRTSVDKPKGRLVYVYYNSDYSYDDIINLIKLNVKYSLDKYPIAFVLLDDKDNDLAEAIISYNIINKFTQEEQVKFSKFISRYTVENDEKLKNTFRDLVRDKQIIVKNNLEAIDTRLSAYCNNLLCELYPNIIPFPFDGFDGRSITNAKKNYLNVCTWMLSSAKINEQSYHLLTKEVKNRVDAVLINESTGWGIISKSFETTYPQNSKVKLLYDELDEGFKHNNFILIEEYYNRYIEPPYGLNDYSFTMLILSYILYQGSTMKVVFDNNKLKVQDWAVSIFTDRGIKLSQLKSSKLIKVEIEGYLLKYIDICERIEKNNEINKFEYLLNELENLLTENDPPEELVSRIDGAKIRAEHGVRTYEKKKKDIAKLRGSLEEAIEKEDYKILIATIKVCNNILLDEDEINGYSITSEQEEILNKILNKADTYILKNYMAFIRKANCQSVAQLTAFEKWMKALRDDLRSLHYEEQANATHNRLSEVIDNVDKIKETQLAVESTNKFLNLTKPNVYTGQEQLLSWQEEGNKLIDYVNNNHYIDDYKKNDLLNKIKARLSEIKHFLDGISEYISEVLDKAYELETIDDCYSLLNTIESILAKRLRDKDKEDIVEIGNFLQNFINDIKEVESNSNLLSRKEKFSNIIEKYSELDAIDFTTVFDDYLINIEKKLSKLNIEWSKKYLSVDKDSIISWDNIKCAQWINETESMPYYISNENIELYKVIYSNVIERRKHLKVQSIIDIFKTLKENEKKYCIDILNDFI